MTARFGTPLTGNPRFVATTKCGHVLPYEHSQTVAMIVPTGRFHLHVLANHVKSPVLGLLNIIEQSIIGGCGI